MSDQPLIEAGERYVQPEGPEDVFVVVSVANGSVTYRRDDDAHSHVAMTLPAETFARMFTPAAHQDS